jgi:thiosulfate dehydrogenase
MATGPSTDPVIRVIVVLMRCCVGIFLLLLAGVCLLFFGGRRTAIQPASLATHVEVNATQYWQPPDTSQIPFTEEGKLIRYGRELIAHTSKYLGPNGIVQPITNGMNCQNCHLEAGTKVFGNNYGAVASTYPKFRARSGSLETFEKRINDCIQRSLNGSPLDTASKEMRAIVAYFRWLGSNVVKNEHVPGSGLVDIAFLDRPADPVRGEVLFQEKCAECHGRNGEGALADNGQEYLYPPLWGDRSYNQGAGLFRISMFARFIKANMPLGVRYDSVALTDEEAWDIAAFVNSQQRPRKDFSADWPKIEAKPFDHPFGPFADPFPEDQHKYGPFKSMVALKKD